MTEQNQDGTQRIFISEVQRHQARYRKLIQFTHSSTKAAGAMLLAAVVALIVANTGAYEAFLEFWHTEAGFFFGDAFAGMSLARRMLGLPPVDFTTRTAIGALAHHVSGATADSQPMNANFGLIDSCEKRIRNKQERFAHVAARALDPIEAIRSNPLACDFDRTLQN